MRERLAISWGDPAGIGPEVVLKALAEWEGEAVVLGDAARLREAAQRLGLPPLRAEVQEPEACRVPAEVLFEGRASAAAGRSAAAAVRAGADLVARGEASALVTAPLNKEALGLAGEPYPGHTELLAAHFAAPRVRMMLQGGALRVVLATTHLALRAVADALTIEGVAETLEEASASLRRFGVAARPSLALAALNPHAGEAGRFGDEEERLLRPALELARARGVEVTGPWPADTLFAKAARPGSGYDAVIALYHDQGLIPVKLASFGQATNVTLGLPIVRTSPDHGTAFDIVGRGVAEASSFREALRVARELAQTARQAPFAAD
ncbi:MAG: 4-hydroxythreonine-4-phosphate dehydrogenase PdxA [Planctomycetota bacterium]